MGLIAGCLLCGGITLLIDRYSEQVSVPDSPHTKMVILGADVDDVGIYQLLLLSLTTVIGAWIIGRSSLQWPRRQVVGSAFVVAAVMATAMMIWFEARMAMKWMWDNFD